MEPHRPKGQASLYDLGCTKRKRTEDDGPARELIIRLRPDVQQAVAARDAAIAASIASRPAPVKRPVGRPKVLAPLGVQAPPGERHVWAELQLRSQIFLTFQGPRKLNARKLIILIILAPRKKYASQY